MDYTYTTTSSDSGVTLGVMLGLIGFYFLFLVIAYVVTSFITSRIFKKAGLEQWIAWVPVYNSWKLLEIGGQHGWWIILAFIPVVNIVSLIMLIIAMYNIGLKLGKSGVFVLWAIFLPIVWYLWLAFDYSTWDDSKGAPRLDTQPATASGTSQNPSAPAPSTTITPTQSDETTQTPPSTPAA